MVHWIFIYCFAVRGMGIGIMCFLVGDCTAVIQALPLRIVCVHQVGIFATLYLISDVLSVVWCWWCDLFVVWCSSCDLSVLFFVISFVPVS